MIKLKTLVERFGETEKELPNLEMPYNMFHRAPELKKIQLAKMMITGPHRHELTAAHVFHIILGLPRRMVYPIYQLAQKFLTPAQLADVKQQVDMFHAPTHTANTSDDVPMEPKWSITKTDNSGNN